jgi:DNA-binding transcriptional LysR family regulator
MTYDQVLVFHRIIQAGSFKAAAAQLHKTQPAISLSIKKLEDELEVELFDRKSCRPSLTPHGRAFLERSFKVLQGMNELEGLSRSFRNQEEPEIFMAIDGISPLPQILKVVKNFSDKYAFTKIHLGFGILSEAERKVLDHQAQIGITHFISDSAALEVVPITNVMMMPVLSSELFRERRIRSQADLKELEQVVVSDNQGVRGGNFGLLEGGKKWRITDGHFKREIILAGLGWGHLPEHQIRRELDEKKLLVLEFEDIHPKNLQIHLIRLKKHQLGIIGNKLWNQTIRLLQKDSV